MSRRNHSDDQFERIRRRRPRRSVIPTLTDLVPSEEAKKAYEAGTGEMAPEFTDPGLQELHDRGVLRMILRQLKSGKEATVYVCDGDRGRMAVKLYHDIEARSFRGDGLYSAGRFIDQPLSDCSRCRGCRIASSSNKWSSSDLCL